MIPLSERSISAYNPLTWPLICKAGVLAIIQYIFFSYLAFLQFPESFNPFNNFLSQLGNYSRNPDGAIFYFLAIIFSGILTVIMYGGFYTFYSKKKLNLTLRIILILGITNGIAIFLSGVFAESVNYPLHSLFSFLIFTTLLPLVIIINMFIWDVHDKPIITFGLGWLVIIIDLIFIAIVIIGGDLLDNGAIWEWLSLASYFIWMLSLFITIGKSGRKEG